MSPSLRPSALICANECCREKRTDEHYRGDRVRALKARVSVKPYVEHCHQLRDAFLDAPCRFRIETYNRVNSYRIGKHHQRQQPKAGRKRAKHRALHRWFWELLENMLGLARRADK